MSYIVTLLIGAAIGFIVVSTVLNNYWQAQIDALRDQHRREMESARKRARAWEDEARRRALYERLDP